jgi:5-methylcytosine-specific restriction endonuclease McrA
MTLEQQGAYRNLLDHAWLMDPPCSLPNDDVALAQLSGAGENWPAMAPVVRRWFVEKRGRLVNEKQVASYRGASVRRRTKMHAASMKWTGEAAKDQPRVAGTTRSQRLAEARRKGTHTAEEWQRMLVFFRNECLRCGAKSDDLFGGMPVKDHIVPIYQGGDDSIVNLQPLCRNCNSSKGPDTTDHRPQWCVQNACTMPSEWLPPIPIPISISPTESSSRARRAHETRLIGEWFDREFQPEFPEHRRTTQAKSARRLVTGKLRPDEQKRSEIMRHLRAWKDSPEWAKDGGEYVPGLMRFFEKRCHELMPIARLAASSNGSGQRRTGRLRLVDGREVTIHPQAKIKFAEAADAMAMYTSPDGTIHVRQGAIWV